MFHPGFSELAIIMVIVFVISGPGSYPNSARAWEKGSGTSGRA